MPKEEIPEPIPAATVILLRERNSIVETLMLRKNKDITFGGMWVFPGGVIEDEDMPADGDINAAARTAAARETAEEAGIETDSEDFVWFAQWTPPPMPRIRFRTWFFAAKTSGDETIEIDGDEIHEHSWINPGQALEKHKAGEIKLVAPTWVTLYYLSRYPTADAILKRFSSTPPKIYESHHGTTESGDRAVFWHGDSGYETWDANLPGERHRILMKGEEYIFQNTIEQY